MFVFRSYSILTVALLAAVILPVARAWAAILPPDGDWIAPSHYNGTLYGPSNPAGHWHVTQWGSWDADLPPFVGGATNNHALVYNKTSIPGTLDIVSERPSTAPCTSADGNIEMDAFLEPTGSAYPGYPVGATPSKPVSQMTSMTHTIRVIHDGPFIVHDLNCPVATQSVIATSFILTNGSGQTFFWQICLDANRTSCGQWFFTGAGNQWGYNEPVGDWGFGQVLPGQTFTYNLHLLGVLKAVIAVGARYGLDQNLADWRVTGAYVGILAWGHINDGAHFDQWSLATP